MLKSAALLITLLSLISVRDKPVAAENPVYDAPHKTIHATVRVLALSSEVHSAFGGNQDTYIATLQRGRETEVIKLLDRYPSYAVPIRKEIWKGSELRVQLVRDPSCDTESVFERAGLIQQTLSIVSTDSPRTTGGEMLPCFLLNRDKTRIMR